MKVKNSKWFISGLLITGMLGFGGARAWAHDYTGSKADSRDLRAQSDSYDVLTEARLPGTNYCHLKFPAIRRNTVRSNHPQLEDAHSGDIVDFYGPCDHDPLGRNEIVAQRQEDALFHDRR